MVELASCRTEHARLINTRIPPLGWKIKQAQRSPRYTTHW